jgi:small-conductance mechanosensitive channel
VLPGTLQPESASARQADASPAVTPQEAAEGQEQGAPPQVEATLLQEAGAALDRLGEIQDTLRKVIDLVDEGLAEDEVDLIRIGLAPMVEESRRLMEELPGLIRRIEEGGGAALEIRQRLGDLLGWFAAEYQAGLEQSIAELAALAATQDTSSEGNFADMAAQSQEVRGRFLRDGLREVDLLEQAQAMGFDVSAEFTALDALLVDRTEALVGRLQLRVLERDRSRLAYAEAQSAEAGDEALDQARRRVLDAEGKLDVAAATVDMTVDLLERRGYPTAEYRQLVIQATGEVTGDLFNPRVLLGLAQGWLNDGARWLRDHGPTVLARLFLVLILVWAFRVLFRAAWWLLRVTGILKMPRLASDLLGRLLRPLATVLGLIVGLWTVGVDSTALLTGLGVFSLIVGLALQDSLSNLAAGLFILAHRPYDVDDVIETCGMVGTVVALGLANTTLLTFDHRKIFVPNRRIWGDVIANRSTEETRRVDVEVEVTDRENLDRVFSILHTLLDEHEQVLAEPAPLVFKKGRSDSGRVLEVRSWVMSEHWWELKSTLPALIDQRFDREGIEDPAPRREIVYAQGGGDTDSD